MSTPRGFLLDVNRCTGCSACELACSTENSLGWGRSWRQVLSCNDDHRPGLPTFHLSLACNHCARAPCVEQCPALAIARDDSTGTVQIDPDRCIGCRYCSWVCPFDATRFDPDAGVMRKCTLCDQRLRERRAPACVEGCPTAALRYGPLEGAEEVVGFPRSRFGPAIRFTPLLRGARPPETTWQPDPELVGSFARARPQAERRTSLRSEWPLLVFSLLTAGLAGWILAATLGAAAPSPLAFAGLAALAMATSTAHLGRKDRAWRALLNLRRSWLSREVAAFALFAVLSVAWRVVAPQGGTVGLGAAAALAGLACLFCIDRVYDPLRAGRPVHSADTLLTGLLVAAACLGWSDAAVALLAVKLTLYVHELVRRSAREPRERTRARGATTVLDTLRLAAGGAAAILLLIDPGRPAGAAALIALALGEAVDRARFYQQLRIPGPREAMLRASQPGAAPVSCAAPSA